MEGISRGHLVVVVTFPSCSEEVEIFLEYSVVAIFLAFHLEEIFHAYSVEAETFLACLEEVGIGLSCAVAVVETCLSCAEEEAEIFRANPAVAIFHACAAEEAIYHACAAA